MRFGAFAWALMLALAGPGVAAAAPDYVAVTTPSPTDDVTFQAVESLEQSAPAIEPKLRRGSRANSTDWPAVFFMIYSVGAKSYGCSGAVVGPQVLLTAAHCVPASGKVKLTRPGAPDQDLACEQHPAYISKADLSADFALCRVPAGIFEAGAFRFESVSTAAADTIVNQRRQVLLGGFGCTSESAAESSILMTPDPQGVPRPTYLIGLTTADQASYSRSRRWPAAHYTPAERRTIITKPDGPNVCEGDSGGPVFRLSPNYGADLRPRVIVAINSRVLQSGPLLGPSLLSVTGGFAAAPLPPAQASFAAWAKGWANGLTICGVVGDGSECAAS